MDKNNIKVTDLIGKLFNKHKIKYVFSIVGAGNVHLLNSLKNNKKITSIHPHHEQAGAMACLPIYRLTNNLAVMITTSGGAATNAITAVLDAWADSIPVLIISGQEKNQFIQQHRNLRMWGVQGFDIVKTVSNITNYANIVTDPTKIVYEIEKAIFMATQFGRPGPVWLDIPTDVQASMINQKKLENFDAKNFIKNAQPKLLNKNVQNDILNTLYEKISKAKRPVFIFGNGIRLDTVNYPKNLNTERILDKLIKKFPFPFLTSWNGLDLISSFHELNFGRAGTYGQRCANFVVQNSDLIIAIGTRMAIPQIGYEINEFAREAHKFIVDIDESELQKFNKAENFYLIQAKAIEFIEKMIHYQGKSIRLKNNKYNHPEINNWVSICQNWKNKYPFFDNKLLHKKSDNFLNSYSFINQLNQLLPNNAVIITDMGTALTCTHQAIKLKSSQRLITSTGLGEMGFGLPGAIGACFARNHSPTLLITGDGSMMMNLQELQTIVHHNLPIKIFIYMNDSYLTIKHTQKSLFGERLVGTNRASGVSCPDFNKIAQAFSIPSFKIKNEKQIAQIWRKSMKINGPVIIEVFIHPLQPLVPKTSFNINPDGSLVSPPIEDLYPFLPREEFNKEMLIPIHPKSQKINLNKI